MSKVLCIFLLLSKVIWYLLIVSNIPKDGRYPERCWKVVVNKLYILYSIDNGLLNPVSAHFKAWVCGCLITDIVGSNPADSMDVCLF